MVCKGTLLANSRGMSVAVKTIKGVRGVTKAEGGIEWWKVFSKTEEGWGDGMLWRDGVLWREGECVSDLVCVQMVHTWMPWRSL